MPSERPTDGTERCNVCGGLEEDHHFCVAIESVLGGDIWVYDDGYARVVPWLTRQERLSVGELTCERDGCDNSQEFPNGNSDACLVHAAEEFAGGGHRA